MWAQSTSVIVTDGRTDRFTMTKTALCIALRGKIDTLLFFHIFAKY